ncbi:MAG TPA: DUF547 domain-containing protein [Candidatus Kapabacteria bacterium]|nr:DUF547 domain-containing protein [Candidatus Kapabacteria bacterium]
MTHRLSTHARPILVMLALTVGLVAPAAAKDAAATFDHSKFDHLLSTAVANGRVDYSKFRNNDDFAAYLKSLETASIASLSSNEQLAFWLNAYNALVIRNVLDNPGMKKPTDVKGFFDAKKFKVAGKMLTLNEIENTMIRAKFKEPLIHFGLVCAARSCPPIKSHAFAGKTVRAQLAANASAYLASSQNRFDEKTNTLSLSKIFDWYRGDFGGDNGLKEFAKKYGTAAMKKGLATPDAVKIAFQEYDWTLNSR